MKAFLLAAIAPVLLLPSFKAWCVEPKIRSASVRAGKTVEPMGHAPLGHAPMGDAQLGKLKAESERCIECHGEEGQGFSHSKGTEAKFPKLAGQNAAYLLKQIRDFRSGARSNDQMAIMARSVSDQDVLDIAAYFASIPATPGQHAAHPGTAPLVGQALFEHGDPARGITACASCHGIKGGGPTSSPLTPVLAGQTWRYLHQQLQDWRAGQRRNAPDGIMNQVLKPLSDIELESLTNYLSAP